MSDGGSAVTSTPDGRRKRADRPPRRLTIYGVTLLLAVSVQPFAAFVANNPQYPLPLADVAPFAVVVFVGALAIWWGLARWRPAIPTDVIATCVATTVFAFFKASLILNQYPRGLVRWIQPFVWLLVAVMLVALVFRLAQNATVRTFLVVFLAAWCLISVVTALSVGSASSDADQLVQADLEFVEIEGKKPNVYWFVFDEYARNDQIEKFTGLVNDDFYEELRDRGFEVSETSRASYARTHMSMSSTLAMDYVLQRGNDIEAEFRTMGPAFAGDNATVERFRRHGYDYLFSDQATLPWAACRPDLADHCLAGASAGLSETQGALLRLTPLGGMPFDVPHSDPVNVVDELYELGDAVDQPFFLFAHVNAPHFPYRYGPGCAFRTEPVASAPLDTAQWAGYYRQEIECINELILEALDRLIADDPTALIMLQSDHGSASTVDWSADADDWSAVTLQERFGVLNAMRLPPECDSYDIDGQALVNTFRIVFSCIEGQDIELLDYRAYLSPRDDISQIDAVDLSRFEGP